MKNYLLTSLFAIFSFISISQIELQLEYCETDPNIYNDYIDFGKIDTLKIDICPLKYKSAQQKVCKVTYDNNSFVKNVDRFHENGLFGFKAQILNVSQLDLYRNEFVYIKTFYQNGSLRHIQFDIHNTQLYIDSSYSYKKVYYGLDSVIIQNIETIGRDTISGTFYRGNVSDTLNRYTVFKNNKPYVSFIISDPWLSLYKKEKIILYKIEDHWRKKIYSNQLSLRRKIKQYSFYFFTDDFVIIEKNNQLKMPTPIKYQYE